MAAGMSCRAHRSRALELAAGDGAGRADGYVVPPLGDQFASWLFVDDTKSQHWSIISKIRGKRVVLQAKPAKSKIVTPRSDVQGCSKGGLDDREFGC